MIADEVLKRARVELPKKSAWPWLRSVLLNLGRPRLGGVDLYDADELGIALPITVAYVAAVIGVFLGFFATLTMRATDTVYLSAQMNETGTTCEVVPIPITNTFYASYDGLWSTDPNYDSSKTCLKAIFKGAQFVGSTFAKTMTESSQLITTYMSYTKSRTAINSLIRLWGIETYYPGLYVCVPFSDCLAFGGDIVRVSVGGSDGSFCGTPLSAHIDSSTAYFALDVSQSAILGKSITNLIDQDDDCRRLWGGGLASTSLDVGSRLFSFQVQAVLSAVSYTHTFGVDFDALILIDGHFRAYDRPGFIGYTYVWDYVGSLGLPMWCLDKESSMYHTFTASEINGPDICYVTDGRNEYRYYFPVITQFFVDRDRCGPDGVCPLALCECPRAMNQPECNRRQYTVAVFFADSIESIVALGLKMTRFYSQDPDNYDLLILRAVAPVISYTLTIQQHPSAANSPIQSPWAKGKSYRQLLDEAWKDLCATNDCGVVAFQVEGTNEWPFTNSYTNFAALNQNASAAPGVMACQDYSIRPEVFAKLGEKTPTPLIQNYYTCRKTTGSALLASIGPAVSSANFFGTLGWILLGYCVVFIIRMQSGTKGKALSAHSKAVVGEALDAAKEESLLAVVQQMALSHEALSQKVAALERELSSKGKDQIPAPVPPQPVVADDATSLREAFEQFQRMHRPQQDDQEYALVGAAVTRALRQRREGKEETQATKEREGKLEKPETASRPDYHGGPAIQLVDNPMRLSLASDGGSGV